MIYSALFEYFLLQNLTVLFLPISFADRFADHPVRTMSSLEAFHNVTRIETNRDSIDPHFSVCGLIFVFSFFCKKTAIN